VSQFFSRILGSRPEPEWIDPADLASRLAGPEAPLVVDVRGPEEFDGPLGHIEDARNIPLDRVPAEVPGLAAQQRPIVLVCHTDRRSAAAAAHLRGVGIANVAVLRGGMVAWRQSEFGRG
jgi:rhodanese-related sulfurtransferase